MATATLTGGFTYAPFTVTDISPEQGPATGDTTVTITGTYLDSVLSAVTFGGVSATDVTIVSDTEITCVTPAGTGVVDVVVSQGVETVTLDDAFQYVVTLPSITSVTPNTGSQAGGTSITVIGANFDASSTISIGGNPCTGLTLLSPTEITCTTPAGVVGIQDVVATNAMGSFTLNNGFTYYASVVTLTGASLTAALTTGGDAISVYGYNFDGSTNITIGGAALVNKVYESSILITGEVPAGTAGPANLTATKGAESYQLTDYFNYVAPLEITSITPDSGLPSGGEAFTIVGSGIASNATVTIGGIPIDSQVVVNDTTITGNAPANSSGVKDVVLVQNTLIGELYDSLINGYTYFLEGYLGPQQIDDSFIQLLYVSGGVAGQDKSVQDAQGTFSALNIAKDSVSINGNTTIRGKLVV